MAIVGNPKGARATRLDCKRVVDRCTIEYPRAIGFRNTAGVEPCQRARGADAIDGRDLRTLKLRMVVGPGAVLGRPSPRRVGTGWTRSRGRQRRRRRCVPVAGWQCFGMSSSLRQTWPKPSSLCTAGSCLACRPPGLRPEPGGACAASRSGWSARPQAWSTAAAQMERLAAHSDSGAHTPWGRRRGS